MEPRDGKAYRYFIKNKDVEITAKQVRRAVQYALHRWTIHTPYRFRKARNEQEADLVYEFRGYEDPELDGYKSTIAYMYYPINPITLRGHCVINVNFYFDAAGEGVPMWMIDPIHYSEGDTFMPQGESIDLDQVLGHEDGHGVFGLPHDPQPGNSMSGSYGVMAEYATDRDVKRAQAKGGARTISNRMRQVFLRWLGVRSENY